jgi:hypothetical protein
MNICFLEHRDAACQPAFDRAPGPRVTSQVLEGPTPPLIKRYSILIWLIMSGVGCRIFSGHKIKKRLFGCLVRKLSLYATCRILF